MSEHVVLVTGALTGIGRATAVLMARRGARLALSDVDERRMKEAMAVVTGA